MRAENAVMFIGLLSVTLVSCSKSNMVTVKVQNESGVNIKELEFITQQETLYFQTLKHRSSSIQKLQIKGDSGSKIKFTPDQTPTQEQDLNVYLTRGYHGHIRITIKPDFKVSIEDNLKTGF